MKHNRIFRTLGIAIILALLVAAIPATPARAAEAIAVSPSSGGIGDTIRLSGSGFDHAEGTAFIYFSSDFVALNTYIGTTVTVYQRMGSASIPITLVISSSFEVPSLLSNGDEEVRSGTYYIYVAYDSGKIVALYTFTVIAGEIELDPDEGAVGTEVEITGSDFGNREDIIVEYGGDEIDIEDGDDQTDSDGDFEDTIIIIPPSTAGDHTITVIGDDSDIEAEATFTVEPQIIIFPASGAAGITVTVNGTGFGYRSDVTIDFNNTAVVTDYTTDSDGSFKTTFTVPSLVIGSYDVEAEDEDNNSDKVNFTIATNASLSPTTGNAGTELTVSGVGFVVGGTVIITYDAAQVATATVTAAGTFSVTFNAPTSIGGEHTITATDGTNTKQVSFTMESTAPPIPVPLKPETGIKAKAEAYFDWGDVTDPSGVTYTLQIATDAAFTSIVLEKTGLTESEYTLTKEEKLESTKKEAPYYWHIKAIDGGSNESEWSGIGSFDVGFSLAMPQWAIYTLFGVGALLLGILGLWWGRRTAYYY